MDVETYTTIDYYEDDGVQLYRLDGDPWLMIRLNVDITLEPEPKDIDVEIVVGDSF